MARTSCAGVTISTRSQAAISLSLAVALMAGSSETPGRYSAFRCCWLISAMVSGS